MSTSPDLPQEQDKKLISDQFDEFKEALEVLYLIANISGRLNFVKNWPGAALHIMGEQLLAFDRDGATDRALRAQLEAEADERRLALLEILDALEDKSVQNGALQIEYVENLVRSLGRDLSLLMYSERIVNRFIPPPPPPIEDVSVQAALPEETPAPPEYVPPVISAPPLAAPSASAGMNEEEFFAQAPEDPFSRIQPISLEPAAPHAVMPPAAPAESGASPTQKPVEMRFISSKQPAETDTPDKEQGSGA